MRTDRYVKQAEGYRAFIPALLPPDPPISMDAELIRLLSDADRSLLMAIRTDGDWEGWLKFFLRGIYEVSQSATATARSILNLREEHRLAIAQKIGGSNYGLRLLDLLFEQPIVNVRLVENYLQCAYVTASKIVDQFMDLALLHEVTGWQRNRLYRYEPYLALFEPLIPVAADELG